MALSTELAQNHLLRLGETAENRATQAALALPGLTRQSLYDTEKLPSDPMDEVSKLALSFQDSLRNNPMQHINRNPRELAAFCLRKLQAGNEPFEVIVLAMPPQDYKPTELNARPDHYIKQFLALAQVVELNVGNGQKVYTLQLRVLGVNTADLLRDGNGSLALAASVATNLAARQTTRRNLTDPKCSGDKVQGLSDTAHAATVLAVASELSAAGRSSVLAQLGSAGTVAEVAHTHGLAADRAQNVASTIRTTTVPSPLAADGQGRDVIIVHPTKQEFSIIPVARTEKPTDPLKGARTSLVLGTATSFSSHQLEQLGRVIATSNHGEKPVPVSTLRLT